MGNRVYIVDYDIPVSPAKKRVQFYRDLKKLSACNDGDYSTLSTLSVFRTEEVFLAEAVYFLVTAYSGKAHLYVAEEIVLVAEE